MTLGTSVHPDPPQPAAMKKARRAICFEGLFFTFSFSLIVRDSAPARRSTIAESIRRLDRRISSDTAGRSNYFSSRLSRQDFRRIQSSCSFPGIHICCGDVFVLLRSRTISHYDKIHTRILPHTGADDRSPFARSLESPNG